MTHLRRSLSTLLLLHHRHPLLRNLGRLAYRTVAAIASSYFFDRRVCASLFLRRGMTRPDWVPGGSDLDFTITLRSQPPKALRDANSALQRRIALFNRFSPIPAEVGIFSEAEFARYRREGDVRALEIAPSWLVRRGAKLEALPERIGPIAPHAFSEAFSQFGYLLSLVTGEAPLCRRLSRNLFKHYADVLIYCTMAQQDRYRYESSRWEALSKLAANPGRAAAKLVLEKVERGFAPVDRALTRQIFIDCFTELEVTARSASLAGLPLGWAPIPARPLSEELSSLIEFWRMAAAQLDKRGIPVFFHHHRSTYLSLPREIFQRNGDRVVASLLPYLKMTPISGKPKFPVTDEILRVLSHCSCYLAYAFDIRGVRFNPRPDGELQWFMPLISPWGSASLMAKRSTVPSDIRRDFLDQKRVAWTEEDYLPRLNRAIQGTVTSGFHWKDRSTSTSP